MDKDLKNRNISESLRTAGVGSDYRTNTASLKGLGELGESLTKDLKSGEIQQSVDLGWSWVIEGDTQRQADIIHLMCRGFILNRIPSRIIPLMRLIEIIQDREVDNDDALGDIRCLFVEGWFDKEYPEAFTDKERYRLSWWFSGWLNSGRSLVLQATSSDWSKSPKQGGWWSTYTINSLKEKMTLLK